MSKQQGRVPKEENIDRERQLSQRGVHDGEHRRMYRVASQGEQCRKMEWHVVQLRRQAESPTQPSPVQRTATSQKNLMKESAIGFQHHNFPKSSRRGLSDWKWPFTGCEG